MEPKVYSSGIEKKLIENIYSANNSIIIAMAWFTNDEIKKSLLKIKRIKPELEIEIVVDNNFINEKHFYNFKAKFDEENILVREKVNRKFLHHKFMVIDNLRTITGSYNYTNKAKSNLENIVIIESEVLGSHFSRIFKFYTILNYIDENIQLLFDFPKFAQSILSAYYCFTKREYIKYKKKIEFGYCFTHDNGFYDEIKYAPGFIFNPKIYYEGAQSESEFQLPVNKEIIKSWIEGRNQNLILDSYRGNESEYHLINDDLKRNTQAVENYFKQKVEHTYRKKELKSLIENNIDIIIEDDLWLNNFEPFITKSLIEKIFEKIETS